MTGRRPVTDPSNRNQNSRKHLVLSTTFLNGLLIPIESGLKRASRRLVGPCSETHKSLEALGRHGQARLSPSL